MNKSGYFVRERKLRPDSFFLCLIWLEIDNDYKSIDKRRQRVLGEGNPVTFGDG